MTQLQLWGAAMSRSASIGLWLRWTLATLSGHVAAQLVFLVIGQRVGGDLTWVARGTELVFPIWGALHTSILAAAVVEMSFAYALVGTAQWLVLRREIPKAGWWVAATAIGGAIGQLGVAYSQLWSAAVLGIVQALVLRRSLPNANWWPLATMLGLLSAGLYSLQGGRVGLLGGGEALMSGGVELFESALRVTAIKGTLFGVVTGVVLISMLLKRESGGVAAGPTPIDARLGAMIGVVSGSAVAGHIAGRAIAARVPGSWSSEGLLSFFTFIIAIVEGIAVGGLLGRWVGRHAAPTIVRSAACAGAVFGAGALNALAVLAGLGVGWSVFIPIVVGGVGGAWVGFLAGTRLPAIRRQNLS
jgi:hypothetical protein